MESVSWDCEDALRDHQWVTQLNVILKENEILAALNYDLNMPSVIQWRTVVILVAFASQSKIHEQWHKHREAPCSVKHGN